MLTEMTQMLSQTVLHSTLFTDRLMVILLAPETDAAYYAEVVLTESTDGAVLSLWHNELPGPNEWPDIVAMAGYGLDEAKIKDVVDRFGGSVIYTTDTFFYQAIGGVSIWNDEALRTIRNQALRAGHQGLSTVAKIKQFEWPDLSTYRHHRQQTSSQAPFLPPTSFLSEHGYRVAKGGPSKRRRQEILTECVTIYGLQALAKKIVGLILSRRNHDPEKFAQAIDRWESDLAWLKAGFYREQTAGWRWPYFES